MLGMPSPGDQWWSRIYPVQTVSRKMRILSSKRDKLIVKRILVILFLFASYCAAQQSPHGEIKIGCEQCHTADSWKMRKDSSFDHNSTGFGLTGNHKTVACISCHQKLVFAKMNSSCLSCHLDAHKSELGNDCQRCHSTTTWLVPNMRQKHQQTRFPLIGAHTTVDCEACHAQQSTHHYAGTPIACISCHQNEFQTAANPNHILAGFDVDCARCHSSTATTWSNGFDHNQTRFPLSGAHRTVLCSQCHTNNVFTHLKTDCYSCHIQNFTSAQSPNHVSLGFDHSCQNCHTTTAWQPAQFDHSTTHFLLTGAHITVACQSCHVNGNYQITYTSCYQCHNTNFNTSSNPNHVAGNFSHDCTTCHTTTAWSPANFDHNTTHFSLTGAHVSVACVACHTNGNFQLVYSNCYQCHSANFTGTTNPNHVAGNFSHDCTTCHSTLAWTPATFDHNTTHFPLTGKHTTLTCQQCHANGNYQLTYTDCYQCHSSQYQNATDPNHVAGNFSHDCSPCHNTNSWSDGTFNHTTTGFALVGQHALITCQSCHVNNNYSLLSADCNQCHNASYTTATNPNHVARNFSLNCSSCHTSTAWSPASFDHNTTHFPLTGAHPAVACLSCHVGGNYNIVYTDCYQCHSSNFTGTTNPDHVALNLSQDCTICHSTSAWTPASFDHNTTHFPLTGAHTSVACLLCHTSGNFKLVYTDCYQCHSANFTGILNPNHVTGNYSHNCTTCHTTTAWTPATFDHSTTHFPLTGAHPAVACLTCHIGGNYQLVFTDCYQCHSTNFAGATSPDHTGGLFSHDCTTCHNTTAWTPATFDHNTTHFQLTGKHLTITCQACHLNGNYQLTYTDCYQCHSAEYQRVTDPNHVAGNFSHNCLLCHTTNDWSNGTFNHTTTGFPLLGIHQTTACVACHVNNNYTLSTTDCYQCHNVNFTGTKNPDHVAGAYSHDCTTCHTLTGWTPATFDHNTTHFQLTGAHSSVVCLSCHTNNNYQLMYTNCYQCHSTNFTGALNPNHVTGNFSQDCTTCHTTTAWSPATFDHNTTHFPLTGYHLTMTCQTCHTNGNYQLVYTNCYQCHSANFTGALNPNHVAGNFSQDCTTCHNTTAWSPATFDHNTTHFPLTGFHLTMACQTCHTNGNFQLVYSACYQCHNTDFTGAINPNHVAGNYSQDCTICHNTTAWSPASFDHNTTHFPLTGAHVSVPCQTCHTNGNFQLVYTNCYQCHSANFTGALNPNHVTGNYSHDCSTCHNTTDWTQATFDHNTTHFPLTGVHTSTACLSCHVNSNYQLVYANCYQCHSGNFTSATNPDHVAGNFPQDCSQCHTTTAWTPATFDHNTTHFPLTGFHLTMACQTCHTNGNYQLVYANCYQCHSANFTGALNPNHVAGNFSQTCTMCHNTTAWNPATFDHNTTHFPLTGYHLTMACQTCHTNGNYQLVYTNCYQCHSADFTGALNPNHVTGNFSQDCTTCHTTTAWSPATFDHSTTHFPLTGAHPAVACISCHTNGNYQLVYTSCYQCHSADFTGALNPNHVAGNFSQTCTTCHNTTAWSPATFDHSTTHFQLTGAHSTGTCQSCHINGNYQLVYTDCYQCHSTDYAGAASPPHASGSFPHNCATCHTTTVWTTLSYNHDTQYFKINSGTHLGRWTLCADCHTVVSDYSQFTCIQCHAHNSQANVTSNHSGVNGFTYTPTSCYSCHRNT
ncbi:MAG: hypothetical protein ACHQQQ_11320 [Bacteroidota bacterium]